VQRAAAGKIDDQVAGLGRQGNARVGIVEADRLSRHAAVLQRGGELAADRGLLSGHALDAEGAEKTIGGGLRIDRHDIPLIGGAGSCSGLPAGLFWRKCQFKSSSTTTSGGE